MQNGLFGRVLEKCTTQTLHQSPQKRKIRILESCQSIGPLLFTRNTSTLYSMRSSCIQFLSIEHPALFPLMAARQQYHRDQNTSRSNDVPWRKRFLEKHDAHQNAGQRLKCRQQGSALSPDIFCPHLERNGGDTGVQDGK